jgi:hypothetical protein
MHAVSFISLDACSLLGSMFGTLGSLPYPLTRRDAIMMEKASSPGLFRFSYLFQAHTIIEANEMWGIN